MLTGPGRTLPGDEPNPKRARSPVDVSVGARFERTPPPDVFGAGSVEGARARDGGRRFQLRRKRRGGARRAPGSERMRGAEAAPVGCVRTYEWDLPWGNFEFGRGALLRRERERKARRGGAPQPAPSRGAARLAAQRVGAGCGRGARRIGVGENMAEVAMPAAAAAAPAPATAAAAHRPVAAELASERLRVAQLEAALVQYEQTLQRTLDDRARERTQARLAAERAVADVHVARKDAEGARETLAALEQRYEGSKAALSDAAHNESTWRAALAAANEQVEAVKAEAEAARAERDEERKQAQELLADLAFTKNELEMMAPLKDRVKELEAELDAAKGGVSAAENAADAARTAQAEAHTRLADLQHSLDEHKTINLRQVKALAKEKDAKEKLEKENVELKQLLEEAFARLEAAGAQ